MLNFKNSFKHVRLLSKVWRIAIKTTVIIMKRVKVSMIKIKKKRNRSMRKIKWKYWNCIAIKIGKNLWPGLIKNYNKVDKVCPPMKIKIINKNKIVKLREFYLKSLSSLILSNRIVWISLKIKILRMILMSMILRVRSSFWLCKMVN